MANRRRRGVWFPKASIQQCSRDVGARFSAPAVKLWGAGAFPNARRDRRREQEYPMTQSDWTRRKFLGSGVLFGLLGGAGIKPARCSALAAAPLRPQRRPNNPSVISRRRRRIHPARGRAASARLRRPTQPAAAATSGGTLVTG